MIVIKLVYCITKKPGMSDADFFHYWEGRHAAIGAGIPGLRRFVQSHRLTVHGDEHTPDYDGMVELWFDNIDALLAARGSREWKESTEDEANFINLGEVAYFVSEEHVILDKTT
jgi:uncharacterized protein (TIGR02118 family)